MSHKNIRTIIGHLKNVHAAFDVSMVSSAVVPEQFSWSEPSSPVITGASRPASPMSLASMNFSPSLFNFGLNNGNGGEDIEMQEEEGAGGAELEQSNTASALGTRKRSGSSLSDRSTGPKRSRRPRISNVSAATLLENTAQIPEDDEVGDAASPRSPADATIPPSSPPDETTQFLIKYFLYLDYLNRVVICGAAKCQHAVGATQLNEHLSRKHQKHLSEYEQSLLLQICDSKRITQTMVNLPHPSSNAPIPGLKLWTDGFGCVECRCAFHTTDTLDNHFKKAHKNNKTPRPDRFYPTCMQRFHPGFGHLFAVELVVPQADLNLQSYLDTVKDTTVGIEDRNALLDSPNQIPILEAVTGWLTYMREFTQNDDEVAKLDDLRINATDRHEGYLGKLFTTLGVYHKNAKRLYDGTPFAMKVFLQDVTA
jgi:hypothetical protein